MATGIGRRPIAAHLVAVAWLALIASPGVLAQEPPRLAAASPDAAAEAPPGPRTGDAWLDLRFEDIDRYEQRYRASLVDELVRYHGVPRAVVEQLLDAPGWTAGEVYYACALAHVAGRPCSEMASRHATARQEGWEAVATALGVAPASPQFARLKRGVVDTYARWGRPLALDAELEREARRKPKSTKRPAPKPTH